jgi:hypothetical protein
MKTETKDEVNTSSAETTKPVEAVKEAKWGELPEDNFGYASDEERRAKRGLEDWEMIDAIPDSQKPVPRWFIGIIVAVMLVAVGLSFPFWGDRPGYEREWIDWGFGAALLYVAVFGTFVYFMVNFYGSKIAGRIDNDKLSDKQKNLADSNQDEVTLSENTTNAKNDVSKD